MAQFVKCPTCGKPYLDKGGTVCPHCARAGRPMTPAPVSAPKPPPPPVPAAPAAPTPPPPAARTPPPPPPAPAAASLAMSDEGGPPPAPPARVQFAAAATMIAIPSQMGGPAPPAAPARRPEPSPPAIEEHASHTPPPSAHEAVVVATPPRSPSPHPLVSPAAIPAPAPPAPAQIPVATKTLIFAPIAPPVPVPPPAAAIPVAPPAVRTPPPAAPPQAAPPFAHQVRSRHDTPGAVYAGMRTPEIGDPPTAQAGQMNVRPLRPTPVVGMPIKVVARGAEPTDLSTLSTPPDGGRRSTAELIGAPKAVDPTEKRDTRQRPAHAEGVRVVLPESPVTEVGRDAAAPAGERGTGEIKALRVRLTQELAVVKPPEPNRKKIAIFAGLGGMVLALIVWWLIG